MNSSNITVVVGAVISVLSAFIVFHAEDFHASGLGAKIYLFFLVPPLGAVLAFKLHRTDFFRRNSLIISGSVLIVFYIFHYAVLQSNLIEGEFLYKKIDYSNLNIEYLYSLVESKNEKNRLEAAEELVNRSSANGIYMIRYLEKIRGRGDGYMDDGVGRFFIERAAQKRHEWAKRYLFEMINSDVFIQVDNKGVLWKIFNRRIFAAGLLRDYYGIEQEAVLREKILINK